MGREKYNIVYINKKTSKSPQVKRKFLKKVTELRKWRNSVTKNNCAGEPLYSPYGGNSTSARIPSHVLLGRNCANKRKT